MAHTTGYSMDPMFEKENTNIIPNDGEGAEYQHIPAAVINERKLKKSIEDIVGRLGSGIVDPVPYETAWVARIPLMDNLDCPAFPLSLQWLRNNQQDDGSWGMTPPFSPHSSTLNTLAAIVALAQWNDPDDKLLIQRGIKALWKLAPRLLDEEHKPVGFELILPVLQSGAQKFGLDIPHEFYKIYEQKSSKKLNFIFAEFKKYGYSEPAIQWNHFLEILDNQSEINMDNSKIEFSPSLLLADGSIGASPSATAYLLKSERLKGRNIPKAEHYLMEIYSLHQGGISQSYPIDIFELAWSIDFFLKAGFSAKDPIFASSISLLSKLCTPRDTIGFCSHFKLPDADDTAVALYVLHQAGYEASVENLLKFFNGNHLTSFMLEMRFSLSVNINALNFLRLFQHRKDVNEVIQKVVSFLENEAAHEKQVFVYDKWHKSPYYSTSRAVFSLHGLNNNLVSKLISFFVENQNKDGGWGKDGQSTVEESAYVTLALCFAQKNGYHFSEVVLPSASEFLLGANSKPNPELWIAKVLYRPTLVVESAILAAQYAITKTLEVTRAQTILKESKPYYVHMVYSNNSCDYTDHLLSFSPAFDLASHSEQVARVTKNIFNRLLELKLIKEGYYKKMTPDLFMYSLITGKESDEYLFVYIMFGVVTTFLDDILDNDWERYMRNVSIVKQVFQTLWEIMSGELKNIDEILPLEFPKFIPICKIFFDVRQRITCQSNDIREFLIELKNFFDINIAVLNNGLPKSPEEYLHIKHNCSAADLFCSLRNTLENLDVPSFEDCKHFLDIKYYGSSASVLVCDIFSFSRDEKYDKNFVLLKRDELQGSIQNALHLSVRLYNQLIYRMLSAKRAIQNDPKYKDNVDLFKAISIFERYVDGLRHWASQTTRYKVDSETVPIKLSEIITPLTDEVLNFIVDDYFYG